MKRHRKKNRRMMNKRVRGKRKRKGKKRKKRKREKGKKKRRGKKEKGRRKKKGIQLRFEWKHSITLRQVSCRNCIKRPRLLSLNVCVARAWAACLFLALDWPRHPFSTHSRALHFARVDSP